MFKSLIHLEFILMTGVVYGLHFIFCSLTWLCSCFTIVDWLFSLLNWDNTFPIFSFVFGLISELLFFLIFIVIKIIIIKSYIFIIIRFIAKYIFGILYFYYKIYSEILYIWCYSLILHFVINYWNMKYKN